MIVITGAAGFIGSNMVATLNSEHFKDLVLVDDFSVEAKKNNLANKNFSELVDRNEFHSWLMQNHRLVQIVIHLGARTDTAEFNKDVFDRLNLEYSKTVWNDCVEFGLPLIYASSAATYGLGEYGYIDSHEIVNKLMPLNPYGVSKNEFDKWVLLQERTPFFWVGLKFFNVYGPNEYHKGRMASVVFHAFNQIKKDGSMKLFRSHKPEFRDGEQSRDFIYVEDLCDVILFFLHHRKDSGIYNLGTGMARSFLDLTKGVFNAMKVTEDITFIDTPEDIRDKYQYFTEASMTKLRNIGYSKSFVTVEEGTEKYVQNYLLNGSYR